MKSLLLLLLTVLIATSCQEPASSTATTTSPAVPTSPPAVASPAPADTADTPAPADTADTPAAVLHRYYAAIDARDYPRAYAQWSADGTASKQTLPQFSAGFTQTAHVTADVSPPGPIEGAAGSRYVEVPLTVRAETKDGHTQRFTGTYTLRKTVVDGATPEQRRWHLYSAALKEAAQ